jgi:hypothetical protein
MCTKKIGENQIILKIEGKEVQKKIDLLVIPYDVNFFSSNDTLIENNIMPSGNADNPYIIKFKLVDINNKTIDCPDKFSYHFSNSNTTFTDYHCNSNQTLYINNSFTKMDKYSFIIPMMNKTYLFNINHGEPIIDIKYIDCTEKIDIGQKANIILSLDVKDKYNNSVSEEEIINNLNIILGYRDINDTLFSLEIEENENGLLKYSTKIGIQTIDSYLWRIFYNGKNIDTSKDYITKVYPETSFVISNTHFNNGSTINCIGNKLKININSKDQFGQEIETNIFKMEKASMYSNNSYVGELECEVQLYDIDCDIRCVNFKDDSFLLFKFNLNDNTAIFFFDVKK